MSALTHFPEDFGAAPRACSRRIEERACRSIHEIDYGTPALDGRDDGHADHRRRSGHRARRHLDHARRAWSWAPRSRSSAPPTCIEAFGSCRLCLVEIEGRAGTPASCTTPVAAGMVVHTQTERLEAPAQAA